LLQWTTRDSRVIDAFLKHMDANILPQIDGVLMNGGDGSGVLNWMLAHTPNDVDADWTLPAMAMFTPLVSALTVVATLLRHVTTTGTNAVVCVYIYLQVMVTDALPMLHNARHVYACGCRRAANVCSVDLDNFTLY
jgi:hypothetical protein